MSRYSQSDHGSNHDADASDLEAGGSDGPEEGGVDEVNESVEEGKSNYDDRYGDEDGVSFLDHQVNEAIQQRREEKEKARAAGDLAFVENVDEKLGDDFEDTPWVPPTLELAWEYRLSKLYRGGKAKLSKVALTRATDIGLGVPLYFIFVKTIGLAALLMTFLSLPALLFAYTGHNIKDEDRDAFGLYKLSIGNIGHNKDSGSYDEKSACSTITDMRCVKLFGEEFSMLDVANILSVCEVSSAMVCLFAFVYLVRTHAKMNKRAENRTCSISDYSVMVENVPPDVTMDELIQHFSELYPLDKPDWKQRPGVEGAEPVKHSTNSGFSAHKGTWVAEATVFTKIGAMIRQFKSKQMLMDNLLRCRAKMKMYAENTCHAHGPNPGKFRKAEREMMETGIRIDKLTTESLKQARRKLTGGGRFSQKLHENASNLPGGIPAEALVAFVVFNYSESMARCVEDYEHYNSFPFKLFMPKKLMLRGRHIRVVRGPEPDEIMWENLEVSSTRKFLRRSFSAAVALCLILFGFAFVLQAARYKAKFDEDVPKLAFCDSEIPAVYGNTYDLPAGVQLVRPDVEKDDEGYTRDDYDLECSTLDSGSFYAIYTEDGNVKRPLTEYSTMACIAGDCPIAGANMSCPCVTTTSTENCQTLHCFTDENWDCSKFKAGTIGGCFCYQELLRMFASSFLGMVSDLMSQDDACADFFSNYALAMGLSVAAALCTVAINVFLKKSMKYLATGEFHVTVDEEQSATIAKVFAATYINMAFVALAAYGLWKDKPSVLRTMQIFHGDFADFTPQWYAVVGSYLVTTFIFQMFGPMGVALLKYYIIFPCRMCRAHPKISAQASHKYAMQADVNALELGGTFDTTVNNAQLLSLFFFGMTYAPGLPFMMPLLLLAYVMYFRVDKMLLMRFYERPPKMGDAVMRVVLMLMPWAIVIRLGVACWMYSSTSLFPYHRLKLNEIPNVSMLNFDRYDEVYNEWVIDHRGKDILFFNTGTRIMRGTVFPLFCLMVVIAVSVILFKLMRHSPLYYLFNMFNWLRNHLKLSRVRAGPAQKVFPFELAVTGDPLRAEVAPFTGDYFQFLNSEFDKSRTVMRCLGFLKKFVAPDLTEEELQQGWRVSYNGPYKVKMCQWAKATRIADAARPAGSVQRTYEMISCHGCWSYQLQRIPMYKKIMIAIMEGMESVAHDIENEAGGGTGAGSGASGHMSVLAKYEKRQNDKKTYHTEKQKAKEAVWKNPGPGVKKGRIQPVSDEQLFDAIDRDCDDMDSPQRKDSDSSDDSDDD